MIYVSSPVISTVKGQTLPLSSCACFRDLMFLCVSMRLYEEADTSKHRHRGISMFPYLMIHVTCLLTLQAKTWLNLSIHSYVICRA